MAITAHKLRRLEVWDKWAPAGGVRLAVIVDALQCTAISNLETSDRVKVALPIVSAAAPFVVPGAVLRVDEADALFDEWMILEGPDDEDATMQRTVTAAPLVATDMASADLIRHIDSDGVNVFDFESLGLTAAQQITQWVLPAFVRAGMAWIALGTIETDKVINLVFSWDQPLAILQQIASLTETELNVRRSGGGYVIDLLLQIASADPIADLRFDKNLRPGTKKSFDSRDQATRVFPKGASEDEQHATMSRATWRVTAIAALVVSLEDPAGGAGPIQFDGQLAGLNGTTQAYLRKTNGGLTAVSASSALNQTVTVASVADLVIGDLIQFRADAVGSDLTWLDSPPDRLSYGLKVGVVELDGVPSTNNVLKNSSMRSWLGAADEPPDNWTKVGSGTIDRQAVGPYTEVGGFSVHRVGVQDGDGIISDAVPVSLTALRPYVSGYAGLWVVAGQVRVDLVFTTPTGPVVQPLPPDFATNSVLGQWEDLGASGIDALSLGATAVQLRVVQHGGTPADFYLDYGQVTESASQLPFAESSGGTQLWQAANERLRTNGAPLVSYSVAIVDLAEIDAAFADDTKVVVGGRVRLTDPPLGIAITARIVQLERNYMVPGDTQVTLSNKPDDLTGTLARPRPARHVLRGAASGQTAPYSVIGLNDFKVLRETADSLTRGWSRGSLVAEVWAGYHLFAVPVPDDPWTLVRGELNPLPSTVNEFTVPKPREGFQVYWHVEARLSDLTAGDVREGIVDSAPTQPPIIELDDSETATTGTQWIKITERGLRVLVIEVQTQIGSEPVSAFGPPTRGPGDSSVVRGGALGAGEYEHDVPLDATRLSWIVPRLTLDNGQPPKTLGPFGFDRDKRPNILTVTLTGTVLSVLCDSDTKSIKINNSANTWIYQADGVSLQTDVSNIGTNGGSGLGAAASDTYTITAQSDPLAYVDVDTLTESRNQVIGGSSAPPPSAKWNTPGVIVSAPATNGSANAKINLFASSAPVGWTVQIFIYVGTNSSGTPTVDHTADLTPALSAPPTVATDYTYATSFVKSAHTAGTQLITMKVRADLKDGSGVVQDSRSMQTSWYSPI